MIKREEERKRDGRKRKKKGRDRRRAKLRVIEKERVVAYTGDMLIGVNEIH